MTKAKPNTPENIAIIGAGGHAKVVISSLHALDTRPSEIFVSATPDNPQNLFGQPIQGMPPEDWWQSQQPTRHAHIAIGNNKARQTIASSVSHVPWATIIHPTAIIHDSAKIGHGVFISANSVIQPDAVIGDHTIINTGAIIEHDCKVASFCHIAPRVTLCGNTSVGDGTLIGVGSVTIPGITIGSWAAIGAGSTIIRPIENETTVFGTPARRRPNA